MKKIPLYLLLVFTLTSCYSKLKVVVQSADRDTILKDASEIVGDELITSLLAAENFVFNARDQKNQVLENIKASFKPATAAPETVAAYSKKYDELLSEIDNDLTNARDKLSMKNNREMYVHIMNANLKIMQFKKDIQFFSSPSEDGKTVNVFAKTNLVALSETKTRERFPILGDPLMSYVTKKDKEEILWKSLFNRTVSHNFFGNSDVAIILRSNPPEGEARSGDYNNNFTIKGVRMDASDATNAFFTGITQTINFAASQFGFNLPNRQSGTATNPLPDNSDTLITNIEQERSDYAIKKRKLEDIQRILINKIVLEDIQSKAGTDLDDAILRIEKFWEDLKTELNK